MLLPDSLKTSRLAGESGYDTYLRDAHKQVRTIRFDQSATLHIEFVSQLTPCSSFYFALLTVCLSLRVY